GLLRSTVTETMTPPLGSLTVPWTVPDPPSCASTGAAANKNPSAARTAKNRILMINAPGAAERPIGRSNTVAPHGAAVASNPCDTKSGSLFDLDRGSAGGKERDEKIARLAVRGL